MPAHRLAIIFAIAVGVGAYAASPASAAADISQPAISLYGIGGMVLQPFSFKGFALDAGAATGTGCDAVHVWATPLPSGAPVFLGTATYGFEESEAATYYGDRFRFSGYRMTAAGLPGGRSRVTASMRSTVTGDFARSTSIDLDVLPEGVPGQPEAVSAIVVERAVQLMWLPPSTGGVPTSYVIEAGLRPLAMDARHEQPATQTSLRIEGVPDGTYYVRVRGRNAAGARGSISFLPTCPAKGPYASLLQACTA